VASDQASQGLQGRLLNTTFLFERNPHINIKPRMSNVLIISITFITLLVLVAVAAFAIWRYRIHCQTKVDMVVSTLDPEEGDKNIVKLNWPLQSYPSGEDIIKLNYPPHLYPSSEAVETISWVPLPSPLSSLSFPFAPPRSTTSSWSQLNNLQEESITVDMSRTRPLDFGIELVEITGAVQHEMNAEGNAKSPSSDQNVEQ
jgi:hypothetical protein